MEKERIRLREHYITELLRVTRWEENYIGREDVRLAQLRLEADIMVAWTLVGSSPR